MNELLKTIKTVYPYAEIIPDAANCNYSVKFTLHGLMIEDVYFAIKTKEGLEIYKNKTGLMTEIIESCRE